MRPIRQISKPSMINRRLQSDAGFKVWYSIKQQLTGDNAESFFTQNVKGFQVPGGQEAKASRVP